jgi:hypothetical protein
MGWERAQVLRRKARSPCEREQGSAAKCLHDSYADNYTTSHRSHKTRCTRDNRRGATLRYRGLLRPFPQPPGGRRLVLSFQAGSGRAQVDRQIPPAARSGRLACCGGAGPVCLSIVSLLFLYCFSIVPLLLASFAGSNGAGTSALPTKIPGDCRLASGDCEAIGGLALILSGRC